MGTKLEWVLELKLKLICDDDDGGIFESQCYGIVT